VARLRVHRRGQAAAENHGVGLVLRKVGAGDEPLPVHLLLFLRLDGGSEEGLGLVAVADEAHQRDLRGRHLDALVALDGAAQLGDVVEAELERLLGLVRGEAALVDLQVAEPAADGAPSEAAEGLLLVTAKEDQADRAEDDDEQRDGGAAAVAEDVAKRDAGDHVVLLTRRARVLPGQSARPAAARSDARATSRRGRAWRRRRSSPSRG